MRRGRDRRQARAAAASSARRRDVRARVGRLRDGGRTRVEGRDAVAWAREAAERGAGEILLTSMDRDGTTDGYDLELTRAVADAVAVPVIASGGAGELAPPGRGRSRDGGADAVLAASIFHYGRYTIAEAKRAMSEAGIAVRGVARRGDEAS